MPGLRPRANSPAGKSFRELRDRFLGEGGGEPSPLKAALAEHAAWAGTHLAALNKEIAAAIAERRTVPTEALAMYVAVSTAYGAAPRRATSTRRTTRGRPSARCTAPQRRLRRDEQGGTVKLSGAWRAALWPVCTRNELASRQVALCRPPLSG